MDADALTVNAVRDGPVSTLILCGDLYLPETGGFLQQAALMKNFRLLMQSLVLILLMENKWRLHFARRLEETGNVIAVDGKLISIFSICKH